MLEMSSAFYNCVFKIVKSLWRITLQNRNVDTTLKGRRCWKLTDAVKKHWTHFLHSWWTGHLLFNFSFISVSFLYVLNLAHLTKTCSSINTNTYIISAPLRLILRLWVWKLFSFLLMYYGIELSLISRIIIFYAHIVVKKIFFWIVSNFDL